MVYCVPTRNICKNMIAKTVIPTEAMILVTKQLMHKGNIMKKKQSIRYLLLTCLAGGLLLGMADSASAEPRSKQRGGCLADPEISALILNGDYQGWRSWMESRRPNSRALELLNEENFPVFSESHRLMQQGQYSEAAELRQQLGLGVGSGRGFGRDGGMKRGGQGNRQLQRRGQAIE